MPNLSALTVRTGKHHMNGHKWQEFIVDYLPRLKTFRFLMFSHVNNEEEMDEIFYSYRTPFWLIDRPCYILENFNAWTKSTCPDEEDYWSYKRVTTLVRNNSTPNDFVPSLVRFHNVHHLEIVLPFDDQFLSVLPRLDRLISLTISSNSDIDADIVLSQLQLLISRAPRLSLLIIGRWETSIIQHLPLYLMSNSIRRLDLQGHHYLKRNRCFNTEECARFLRSPLAKQCEVLQIVVENRSDVDRLIDGMGNLRALKVVFQPDQRRNSFPTREESITGMASGYSRTFRENLDGTETVRLWIR